MTGLQIVDGCDYLRREMSTGRPIVFEGGQGALLDPEYGFHPHVTKTTTSFNNATCITTSFPEEPCSEVYWFQVSLKNVRCPIP